LDQDSTISFAFQPAAMAERSSATLDSLKSSHCNKSKKKK